VSLGLPLAGVALNYGVDDLHGTIFEEKIFHMAGAQTPQQQTVAALEKAIRESGREPHQRNSHFEHIEKTARSAEKQTPELAST
jgi:aminodeoxyfutalosine synthase